MPFENAPHASAHIGTYNDVQGKQLNNFGGHTQRPPNGQFRVAHTDTRIGTYNDVQGSQTNNYQIKYNTINAESLPDAKQQLSPFASVHAAFDSHARHPADTCYEGTRGQVLADIDTWIKDPNTRHRIYWLHGALLSGKSTISQSIATRCQILDHLGGSIFFSANDANRNNIKSLFPTIAYQLCWTSKGQNKRTSHIIRDSPDLIDKIPSVQLQELIISPSLNRGNEKDIIVIDALDEVVSEDSLGEILDLILQAAMKTSLRFFVASRLNTRVQRFASINSKHLKLVDLASYDSTPDIRHFYTSRFEELRLSHKVKPEAWVSDAQIDRLVSSAEGLFLYPVAIIKYIDCGGRPGCRKRLQHVLDNEAACASNVLLRLQGLFLKILSQIPQDYYQDSIKNLISTLCLLSYPLRLRDLDALMDHTPGETWQYMQDLHAFFHVPDMAESDSCVRLVHRHFRTWICDSQLAGEFAVDIQAGHSYLGIQCLGIMISGLRRNILNLPEGSRTMDGVSIDRKRQEYVSGVVEYSCRFWYHHLRNGSVANNAHPKMQEFSQLAIFHWIELMGFLHRMEEVVGALKGVDELTGVLGKITAAQIEAIRRFTITNIHEIIDWPPRIYDLLSEQPHLFSSEPVLSKTASPVSPPSDLDTPSTPPPDPPTEATVTATPTSSGLSEIVEPSNSPISVSISSSVISEAGTDVPTIDSPTSGVGPTVVILLPLGTGATFADLTFILPWLDLEADIYPTAPQPLPMRVEALPETFHQVAPFPKSPQEWNCFHCKHLAGDLVIYSVSGEDPVIVCEACLAADHQLRRQTFSIFYWFNRKDLGRPGYSHRLEMIQPTCDDCSRSISVGHQWMHCVGCLHLASRDICVKCYERQLQVATVAHPCVFIRCVVPFSSPSRGLYSRVPVEALWGIDRFDADPTHFDDKDDQSDAISHAASIADSPGLLHPPSDPSSSPTMASVSCDFIQRDRSNLKMDNTTQAETKKRGMISRWFRSSK